MGTIGAFVCPTTGHEVSTGVEVDRSNYKKLSRTKTAVFCPRCRKNHMLAAIWAWLVDEVPESPNDSTSTKSAAIRWADDPNPIHEPFRLQRLRSCEELPLA